MYLAAKHMVTGYDHLAFLTGVIFFLYRMKDIVLYVSLFTLGYLLPQGALCASSPLVNPLLAGR
jgi:HupE / UreJ protein